MVKNYVVACPDCGSRLYAEVTNRDVYELHLDKEYELVMVHQRGINSSGERAVFCMDCGFEEKTDAPTFVDKHPELIVEVDE